MANSYRNQEGWCYSAPPPRGSKARRKHDQEVFSRRYDLRRASTPINLVSSDEFMDYLKSEGELSS